MGAYFSTFVTFGFLGSLCDRPDAQTVLRSSSRETVQKGDGLQLAAPRELLGHYVGQSEGGLHVSWGALSFLPAYGDARSWHVPGRPKKAVLLSTAARKVHRGQFRLVCAWEWWGSMALGKF